MSTLITTTTPTVRRDRRITLVGLLLALGVFSLPFGRWFNSLADLPHMLAYELFIWACAGAVLLFVVWVERRPLSSIGFRTPSPADGLIAIAAGVLILACLALLSYIVFPALGWNESRQMGKIAAMPYWLNVLIVVRAAVSEEILFRGYAIERLQGLTGSRIIAAALPCAIFTLDHVGFWGWPHVFIAGVAGIVLTLLYLWRRNLWVNILAHFLVDAAAFLL